MKDKVIRKTIKRSFPYWIINCLRFYYQRVVSRAMKNRDNNLWVFSAWEGNKYSDNAKYLYEYIINNRADIQCIWFTKNEKLYKKLKNEGKQVCLIGTKESKNIQKKAGVAVYTNGLDDFGDFPYIFGALKVNLWHATPVIKKNYSTRALHGNRVLDFLTNIKARCFSYIYRDLTIATSEYAAYNFRRESLTKNQIAIIGNPRNDIFAYPPEKVSNTFSNDFVEKYQLDKKKYQYITYMPTYRGTLKSQLFLKNIIIQIVENEDLNDFLNKHQCKLLIKGHYLTDISGIEFNRSIIFLDDDDVKDTQKLLYNSELLITDYSTCAIDFALKERDIIFFTPDIDQYNMENGLYEEFVDLISPYKIENIDALIERIKQSKANNYAATDLTNRINNKYNERNKEVGSYCYYTVACIEGMLS